MVICMNRDKRTQTLSIFLLKRAKIYCQVVSELLRLSSLTCLALKRLALVCPAFQQDLTHLSLKERVSLSLSSFAEFGPGFIGVTYLEFPYT